MDFQISDDVEHAKALAEIDKLMDAVPDTESGAESTEGRRLIALSEAVAVYEERRWPIYPNELDDKEDDIPANWRDDPTENTPPIRHAFRGRTLEEVIASLPEDEKKTVRDRFEEIMRETERGAARPAPRSSDQQ